MSRIKVMIVDDQPIVRDGIKMVLSLCGDIDIVTTAANGEEAFEACSREAIDVILMDIRMPQMDGVKATKLIKNKYPDIKIVILTTFNDDEFIFEALKNGATSYLLKDIASEEIINTIKIIHAGGTVLHNNIASRLLNRAVSGPPAEETLTQREEEVAKLVAEGISNRDIAQRLFISEGTVKNHITNIMTKLGIKHRTQIAVYIMGRGNTF